MDEPFACPNCYKSECVCYERERSRENWDLIRSCLGIQECLRSRLTWPEQTQVRTLGDGFGTLTADSDQIWDWSHIRDSTDEAKERMANLIRDYLNPGG
jgi:hypothetical protein